MNKVKPQRKEISRRHFLQKLGAGAGLLPFLPVLNASGIEPTMPKRIFLFFTPNGTVWDQWAPTGTGLNFALAPAMQPLQRHKPYLVPISNLSIHGPSHEAMSKLWTGATLDASDQFADGPSIDQVLADIIGPSTPVRSVLSGCNVGGSWVNARMSYSGPRTMCDPTENPQDVFNKLFGQFQADPESQAVVAQKRKSAERSSILDAVTGRLTSLTRRLPVADRPKIDAHLTALRQIEQRLQAASDVPKCKKPTYQAPSTVDDYRYRDDMTSHLNLLVAALACDLTRVVTFQSSGALQGPSYPYLTDPTYFPDGIRQYRHDISHRIWYLDPKTGQPFDAQGRAMIVAITRWYAGQVANLFDALAAIPEGNGSMLDNILFVWGSELGSGVDHTANPGMFLVGGGGSGSIKSGQHIVLPNDTSHHRLLTTICQAMGHSVDTFGSADPGSGVISGLLS